MDLDEHDFNRETLFLNVMKSLENLGTFDTGYSRYTNGPCWWAIIVFVAVFVSLASCVTVIACGLAIIGYLSFGEYLVDSCGSSNNQEE